MQDTIDNSDFQLIFRDIRQRIDALNDWEIGFIGNVEDQFNKGYGLSEDQIKVLDQIYEKATENG